MSGQPHCGLSTTLGFISVNTSGASKTTEAMLSAAPQGRCVEEDQGTEKLSSWYRSHSSRVSVPRELWVVSAIPGLSSEEGAQVQ